jgi:anti-sigma regulatory factor (Ser/Thr protein kinase)
MPSKNKLTVAGYYENLAKIGDFIEQAAKRARLDDRGVYAIHMAVDEACTNIIEHAYGGEGKGEIRLTCDIQKDGVQVVICDQGAPFDPAQVPEFNPQTPLDERKLGGMGLFFIYSLVDRVEFKFNTPQGNQLILFKRREQSL